MCNFMNLAIAEAKKASAENNVPVGAVIVKDSNIIACAHNTKNSSNVSVNHAEILCIIEACKTLNSWYLNDCDIYVTLKPCDMCLNAIAESRIRKVYYLLESNYDNNLAKNRDSIEFKKIPDLYKYNNILNSFFDELRK